MSGQNGPPRKAFLGGPAAERLFGVQSSKPPIWLEHVYVYREAYCVSPAGVTAPDDGNMADAAIAAWKNSLMFGVS